MNNKLFRLAAAVVLSALCGVSLAKGSASPDTGTGFVPIEQAQRVMIYSRQRYSHTTDGRLLVCPYTFNLEEGNSKTPSKCYLKDDPTQANKWAYLDDVKLEGFVISGLSFTHDLYRGLSLLTVYYRKKD